jgi:2-polyprenyl-6-methoxyphenol hydroxylase-like FAD-dependent oxidoreductase
VYGATGAAAGYRGGMPRAVIAGAGPGGALLGLLLARAGVETVVLERQTDFRREFRGEILMPSGLDALDGAGLAGPMAAVPGRDIAGIEAWRGPRRLFTVDIRGVAPRPPRAVSQPALLEMLAAEGGRLPGYRLLRGAEVRDLLRDGERVAGLRATVGGREEAFRADIVVGADGRFSVLRKRSGLDEERTPQSFDIVWAKVDAPPGFDAARARVYFGDTHFAVLFPSHDGRVQVGWVIAKGAFGDLRRRGVDAWLADLAGHVSPDLAACLRAGAGDLEHPLLLSVVSDRLVRWTRPGLLLLGDAAHPMSPVGGQGLNMALRDAVVAANLLAPALRSGSPAAVDAAALAVQEARVPETAEIQARQARVARFLFDSPRWSRWLLSVAAPPLVRTGIAPWFLRSSLRAFASGLTEVRYEHAAR